MKGITPGAAVEVRGAAPAALGAVTVDRVRRGADIGSAPAKWPVRAPHGRHTKRRVRNRPPLSNRAK